MVEPRDQDPDEPDRDDRDLTMAELKAALEREQQAEPPVEAEVEPEPEVESTPATAPRAPEPPRSARSRARDDELLDEVPATDHHLGRFAGWRAVAKLRWIVGTTLALAVLVAVVLFVQSTRELRYQRLHPLPELEATVRPGTPREATYSDGQFRVGIAREAPYINLVHLPDRDITLARGAEKAQFKVEIRDGETIRIVVLTGKIVETLTREGAKPLLD
jgi:hypothetical protein